MLDYQRTRPEPEMFPPFDPDDIQTFYFDWTDRAYANNPIVWAAIDDIPPPGCPHLAIHTDALITYGTWVSVDVGPFSPPYTPATYILRCSVEFQNGDRSNWSIPFVVKPL
jgi:hypothetical protein